MSTCGKGSIENHGTSIDEEKTKVRCKHCGKEVCGFSRLKQHLDSIGNDNVAAYKHVPTDLKEQMRDDSLVWKAEDSLCTHPPLERNISSSCSNLRRCQPRLIRPENSRIGCLSLQTSILDISHGNASVVHNALFRSLAGLGGSGSEPI